MVQFLEKDSTLTEPVSTNDETHGKVDLCGMLAVSGGMLHAAGGLLLPV